MPHVMLGPQCDACHGELRAPCSVCGRSVRIAKGVAVPHERAFCTGSHMKYESCPGSGKRQLAAGEGEVQ